MNNSKEPGIPYIIREISSEDPDFPAYNLNLENNPNGWQTSRKSFYPQEITVEFARLQFLKCFEIAFHKNKVPSKIELFWKKNPVNEFDFNRLGKIDLKFKKISPNLLEQIESVALGVKLTQLKILFYAPFDSRLNQYKQIRILSLQFYGSPSGQSEIRGLSILTSEAKNIHALHQTVNQAIEFLNIRLREAQEGRDGDLGETIKKNKRDLELLSEKSFSLQNKLQESTSRDDPDRKTDIQRQFSALKYELEAILRIIRFEHSKQLQVKKYVVRDQSKTTRDQVGKSQVLKPSTFNKTGSQVPRKGMSADRKELKTSYLKSIVDKSKRDSLKQSFIGSSNAGSSMHIEQTKTQFASIRKSVEKEIKDSRVNTSLLQSINSSKVAMRASVEDLKKGNETELYVPIFSSNQNEEKERSDIFSALSNKKDRSLYSKDTQPNHNRSNGMTLTKTDDHCISAKSHFDYLNDTKMGNIIQIDTNLGVNTHPNNYIQVKNWSPTSNGSPILKTKVKDSLPISKTPKGNQMPNNVISFENPFRKKLEEDQFLDLSSPQSPDLLLSQKISKRVINAHIDRPFLNFSMSAIDLEPNSFLGKSKNVDSLLEGIISERFEETSEQLISENLIEIERPSQPVDPYKPEKDLSELDSYFTSDFIKEIFFSPFRETGKDLTDLLMLSVHLKEYGLQELPPFFLVTTPREVIEAIWKFCLMLFFEKIPQVLFQTWTIFDNLLGSKGLFHELEPRSFSELAGQTIMVLMEKISDNKNVVLFSWIAQVVFKILEKRFMTVDEMVDHIECSYIGKKPGNELERTTIGKIALLRTLVPKITMVSSQAVFSVLVYVGKTMMNPKSQIRDECYTLLIEVARFYKNKPELYEALLIQAGFTAHQYKMLQIKIKENYTNLHTMHVHNVSMLNSKKTALLDDVRKKKETELVEQEKSFKNWNPQGSKRDRSRLNDYEAQLAMKTEYMLSVAQQELTEILASPLEKATVCSYCKYDRPEFANSECYDNHLIEECPLMVCCHECDTIIEAKELGNHLLIDCSKSYYYYKCFKCQKVVNMNDMDAHKTDPRCTKPNLRKNFVRCPLCLSDLCVINLSFDQTWHNHFVKVKCPNQPRALRTETVILVAGRASQYAKN